MFLDVHGSLPFIYIEKRGTRGGWGWGSGLGSDYVLGSD
jgi:hypothetical protein